MKLVIINIIVTECVVLVSGVACATLTYCDCVCVLVLCVTYCDCMCVCSYLLLLGVMLTYCDCVCVLVTCCVLVLLFIL